MKGVVFTELIEMIEDLMGLEFTNKVIEDARLENEGAYTAIGTYPTQDLLKLLESLSKHAENPQDKIVKGYGECLFYRLSFSFQNELVAHSSAFSFLLQLGDIIKREILKLYPDARTPAIKAQLINPDSMEFHYTSSLKLGDLAEGFIYGCIGYFNENISLTRENLPSEGCDIRFVLQKNMAHE
jgi:hypothetical protein